MRDLPTSAKAAKESGAKFFFSGKPCARGHIAPRYAHGSCTECKREDRSRDREAKAEYARRWRADNPDKCREYHEKAAAAGYGRDYYLRNKEREIKSAMEWRARNLEKAQATARRWYHENREHVKERNKRYEEKYRPKARVQQAEYRAANREKLRAKTRAWREINKELVRVLDANKKARRKSAAGKFTREDIARLMSSQKSKCVYCKVSIRRKFHIDHIQPIARGGSNWPSNLQLLCEPCNQNKHATDPIVYAQRRGMLL